MKRITFGHGVGLMLVLVCGVSAAQQPATPPQLANASTAPMPAALAADTPSKTVEGNTFIAPAGWRLSVRGTATMLEPPEAGSWMALVDTSASDSDAAVAQAWASVSPAMKLPLKVMTPAADRDGWTGRKTYSYQTSPNEHRYVDADAWKANGRYLVVLSDMTLDTGEKRASQISLVYGKLLPKGYERESFAGRRAHTLDAARVAALTRFVQLGMASTAVPGVSFGVIQGGKVVFAGGLGLRELGAAEPVDADTRYMVASNTKALATLMLARLVDQRKLGWDSPAASLLPSFKLGSADTTRQVLVKHLICACTGMPRQDTEWILEYGKLTPAGAMELLGTMQPTSGFGELFQYSNPMAAAAGFIGGHVAHPKMELGAAYDRAMQEEVFGPLGMSSTTHDFARAQRGNVATAHSHDVDGRVALAEQHVNRSIIAVRPAGGAWSSVNDMLKYVAMELAEGKLPDGSQYVSREALMARRAPQVQVGSDISYGMGLTVNNVYGTQVVHHGGDMVGFHSDMIWLPEHGVGAVILTNGDPGWLIRGVFRRKLLEVLFDGRPEADAQMVSQAQAYFDGTAAERKLMTVPADPAVASELAPRYAHPAIGAARVIRSGKRLELDFGEWRSEVGSRINPDGSRSLLTIGPGVSGFEFVLDGSGKQRELKLRDGQHIYVMREGSR